MTEQNRPVSNRDLVDGIMHLQAIALMQLPVKASYAISKNITRAKPAIAAFDEEKRKIIARHALLDEAGAPVVADGQIKWKDADAEKAANAQFDELLGLASDFVPHKIAVSELGNDAKIAPATLAALDWMIVEDRNQEE